MGGNESRRSRRRFLRIAGGASVTGLAGCPAADDHGDEDEDGPEREVDLSGPVPESDQNCTSLDGFERDPEDLQAKEDVAYQRHPQGYQLCANCRFFCPGTTDGIGACTEVEGRIRSQDWCALYQHTERLPERPPSEVDFATRE